MRTRTQGQGGNEIAGDQLGEGIRSIDRGVQQIGETFDGVGWPWRQRRLDVGAGLNRLDGLHVKRFVSHVTDLRTSSFNK